MSFISRNHPQQVAKDGARADVDDRGTPPDLFGPLDDRFHFTVDVAAAVHNAKCPRYYDIAQNGLEQSWAGERVFCNPPFSDIASWVLKAWESRAELVVMLLPANRCEQAWWQDGIEPFRDRGSRLTTEFLRRRRNFILPGQTEVLPNQRVPFGIVLAIWKEPW